MLAVVDSDDDRYRLRRVAAVIVRITPGLDGSVPGEANSVVEAPTAE